MYAELRVSGHSKWPDTLAHLFHIHSHPLAMRRKFRCIHTLNGGNAIAEISAMCNKHRVFENISSFG